MFNWLKPENKLKSNLEGIREKLDRVNTLFQKHIDTYTNFLETEMDGKFMDEMEPEQNKQFQVRLAELTRIKQELENEFVGYAKSIHNRIKKNRKKVA